VFVGVVVLKKENAFSFSCSLAAWLDTHQQKKENVFSFSCSVVVFVGSVGIRIRNTNTMCACDAEKGERVLLFFARWLTVSIAT
jgi:hypothetical protein